MKFSKWIIIFVVGILMFNCSRDVNLIDARTDVYEERSIQGFTVFIGKSALESNPNKTREALELLTLNLIEVTQLSLNSSILEELKLVPIFLDWSTTNGGARYFSIYNGQKSKSIEISNLKNYLKWTNQNQPYIILHELAHAYHDRVLGHDNSQVYNAYQNALSNNIYQNVEYHNGNEVYSITNTAYALTDQYEFFAELTEAYFGLNDYYPFDRSDLQDYDPNGFQMINEAWQQE